MWDGMGCKGINLSKPHTTTKTPNTALCDKVSVYKDIKKAVQNHIFETTTIICIKQLAKRNKTENWLPQIDSADRQNGIVLGKEKKKENERKMWVFSV